VIQKRYKNTTLYSDVALSINTLASGRFRGFSRKNTETQVALSGNFSSLVCATDPVKGSKDAASLLVCTRKNVLPEGCGFFVSYVISEGLLGHLGPLYLALGTKR